MYTLDPVKIIDSGGGFGHYVPIHTLHVWRHEAVVPLSGIEEKRSSVIQPAKGPCISSGCSGLCGELEGR